MFFRGEMLTDRIFALLVVLIVSLVPARALWISTIAEVQLIVGTLVVLYLLLRDPVAGLLLGVAVLLAYFRAYSDKYGVAWNPLSRSDKYPMASLVSDYITPEHLKNAQTNVVDEKELKNELKGFRGVYGEEVYGAQGLDATMPGYEQTIE